MTERSFGCLSDEQISLEGAALDFSEESEGKL
jgi:hypothetical protein